jgi:hypothetical protein
MAYAEMASGLETTADPVAEGGDQPEKPWCLSYPGGMAAPPPHYLQLIATMYIVVPTRL